MNNKSFIQSLAGKMDFTETETQDCVNDLVRIISENLLSGNQVNINGFGLFDVKMKKERIIVDPNTGRKLLVPPRLEVKLES
ncbi:MAG: HU family DNA-binding protein [Bacteroidaceae bacterium]|nr:HU family DNA-binding protein [Bacteroidaceae bacterium]